MDEAERLHVVIGASGGTGQALVRELLRRGRTVRAVQRGTWAQAPAGVEVVAADARDPDGMREVCRGAGVVYNAVNPPFARWRAAFPAVVDATVAGASAAQARLVFVDDTWMYGRVTAPMTEELPYRPVSDKGVLRAWLAERVLAAHSRGDVRAVIGRAPELYGPAVESVLGRNLFGQAVSGRRAFWVGAMDEPLAPLFIEDFAHGLAELGEHEQALGQVWHLPTPLPVTARRFVELVAAAVGRPVPVTTLDERVVRTLGLVWPVARHGAEMLYQFRQPHSVDASKYVSVFGPGQVTAFEVGVARTVEWYRRASPGGLTALGR